MSYISQISPDNGTTTYKLTDCLYGTCSTAANTVAKIAVCEDFNALVHGATIRIYMTNQNTATSPTLTIQDKASSPTVTFGPKPILRYASTAVGTNAEASWTAGTVIMLLYDSTYSSNTGAWRVVAHRNNTTYSAMSVSEGQTGTATSARSMRADYLSQIAGSWSYPVITSLTSGSTLVWNREYRLGSITSLTFTIPAIRTNDANEIRVVFTAGSAITAAITAPSGVTLYGINDVSIASGKVYEL